MNLKSQSETVTNERCKDHSKVDCRECFLSLAARLIVLQRVCVYNIPASRSLLRLLRLIKRLGCEKLKARNDWFDIQQSSRFQYHRPFLESLFRLWSISCPCPKGILILTGFMSVTVSRKPRKVFGPDKPSFKSPKFGQKKDSLIQNVE